MEPAFIIAVCSGIVSVLVVIERIVSKLKESECTIKLKGQNQTNSA